MRKISVLEHITLDGVIQAGGGPDEDPSDGFAYGGWCAPFDDEAIGAAVKKMLDMPIDLSPAGSKPETWGLSSSLSSNSRMASTKQQEETSLQKRILIE
jgi:hypothetical protein